MGWFIVGFIAGVTMAVMADNLGFDWEVNF